MMIDRRTLLVGGGLVAVGVAGAGYASYRGMGSMDDYNASVAETRAVLRSSPSSRDLVR